MASNLLRASPAVRLDPTARVGSGAELGAGVEVGAYAIVEAGATIGDRTRILPHAYVCAPTVLGADCEVHMGAVVGHAPQIRGWHGPGGRLEIGPRTIIREHATVHRASAPGACTTIGADVILFANSHVAHDCQVGDGATLANGVLLAGCVTVGRGAFLSGNVAVHQFVRIGDLAIIGGNSRVAKDVPPFMMAARNSQVRGVNVVGMRRAGMSAPARHRVRQAYRILYRSGLSVSQALGRLRDLPPSPEGQSIIAFIESSVRGLSRGSPVSRAGRDVAGGCLAS